MAETFATEVRDELARARAKFGPVASLHEGYAVILEELDEFFEDVRSNDPERLTRAYRELVQVAAMAQRTAEDAITARGPDPVASPAPLDVEGALHYALGHMNDVCECDRIWADIHRFHELSVEPLPAYSLEGQPVAEEGAR